MANGIKMRTARLPTGASVKVNDILDGQKGLTCVDCGISVRKIREYYRSAGKQTDPSVRKTIFVPTHLSLMPASEHASICQFAADRTLLALAADSNRATGEEIFVGIGAITEYRLHIVERRLQPLLDKLKALKNIDDPEREILRSTLESNNRSLTPYLTTATAVATLFERLEDASQAWFKKHLIIRQVSGTKERWNDFCYDPIRFEHLASELYALKTRRFKRSVAIVMRVRRIDSPKGGSVRVMSDPIAFKGSQVEIHLFAPDSFGSAFSVGDFFVAIGMPWLGQFKTSNNYAVRLRIEFKAQFAKIS